MVWEDLKPRDIITEGAIRNAAAVTLALSGSINCIKHLAAIADEAGLDTDVYRRLLRALRQGAAAHGHPPQRRAA